MALNGGLCERTSSVMQRDQLDLEVELIAHFTHRSDRHAVEPDQTATVVLHSRSS
jgi:hypothetical protein